MATKTKTARRPTRASNGTIPAPLRQAIEAAGKNPEALTKDEAIKALKSVSAAAFKTGPLKAPSTNLIKELNAIDFKNMIGGPLQACVDAQVASSLATVNFINEVGFATVDGKKELVMVDFTHTRKDVDAEGKEVKKEVAIKVPLISMLQVPSLRIEHAIIDFNVKLNSVERSEVSSDFKLGAEVKGGWGPVSFKVTASYQRKSTTGVEVKKEYALNVNVKCVQDEISVGLEKILNLLQ